MTAIEKIEGRARRSPGALSFAEAVRLAAYHFGQPRSGSGSHVAIFKMPWQGDPRINLQNGPGGSAKEYHVKQLLTAIDKLKEER